MERLTTVSKAIIKKDKKEQALERMWEKRNLGTFVHY